MIPGLAQGRTLPFSQTRISQHGAQLGISPRRAGEMIPGYVGGYFWSVPLAKEANEILISPLS